MSTERPQEQRKPSQEQRKPPQEQRPNVEKLFDAVTDLTTVTTSMIAKVEGIGTKVDAIEGRLVELEGKVAAGPAAKKGLFGGRRQKVPIKDTKTNVVYLSKSHAGQVLAAEAKSDPSDHFAYYKLVAAFPDRFVEASPEEAAAAEDFWKSEEEPETAGAADS